MGERLWGGAILQDDANAVILTGRISLLSDGVGRSEIVVSDDAGHEERLLFRTGNAWVPVYHLIQVIRDIYQASEIEAPSPESDQPCPNCGGTRMVQDDEGNWQDCRMCVP